MKKILSSIFLYLLLINYSFAESRTVADLANSVMATTSNLPILLSGICYVSGFFLGVLSAIKLKEHVESKGQIKLIVPIVLIISSAALLAMPTLLRLGVDTFGYNNVKNPNPNSSGNGTQPKY